MALDASIYARFAPQARSVRDFDREAMELDNARQANALNALRLSAGRREEEAAGRALAEQNALAALLADPAFDRRAADAQARLYRAAPTKAAGVIKGWMDADKAAADIEESKAKTGKARTEAQEAAFKLERDKLQAVYDATSAATDPATYAQALAGLQARGVDVSKIPQQFDPAYVAQARQLALTQLQRMEVADKAEGRRLTAAQQAEAARHNVASEAATIRGQDMTAATARRGQNLTDARARELATITKTEAAERRKSEQNDKAITKFSDTLQKEGIPELETAIGAAEGAIGRYKEGEVPGVGRLAGAVPSALLSDEGNDVRQAVASVRNIVLNARSGAAVTDQELRRLVEELGTGVGQSEAALRRGLKKVRERLDKVKENAAAGVSDDVLRAYNERGGIPIKRGGAPAAAAAPVMPSADAIAAELKRRGL